MTTTNLPIDWAGLKAFLPPEPSDTTVTRARAAVAALDAATSVVRADLDEAEQRERSTAEKLVAAALHGHDLSPILAEYRPARAHAEQRLAVLARARSVAFVELTRCEHTDPDVERWRALCAEITASWQVAMSGEPEERFQQLVRFAERYRPSSPEV